MDTVIGLWWWRPGLEVVAFVGQVAQDESGIGLIGFGPRTDAVAIAVEPETVEQVHPVALGKGQLCDCPMVGASGFQGELAPVGKGV
ncbi:hypothetical protein BAY1663_05098 [Pseudomonas sp. BAY1663]|nr:hypothetical protein BAY1663_05098 [Pseudomonas sp. BAY1663]